VTTLLPPADRATPSLPPVERESTPHPVGATSTKSAREATRFRIPPRSTSVKESRADSGAAANKAAPSADATTSEPSTSRSDQFPTASSDRIAPSAALDRSSAVGDAYQVRATQGGPPASLAISFSDPFATGAASGTGDDESSGLSPLLQQFLDWIAEQAARDESDSDDPAPDPTAGVLAMAVSVVAETTADAAEIAQDAANTDPPTPAATSADEAVVDIGSRPEEEAFPAALLDAERPASEFSSPTTESTFARDGQSSGIDGSSPTELLVATALPDASTHLDPAVATEPETLPVQNAWIGATSVLSSAGSSDQAAATPADASDAANPSTLVESIADATMDCDPVNDASMNSKDGRGDSVNEQRKSAARSQQSSDQPANSRSAATSQASAEVQDRKDDDETSGPSPSGDGTVPRHHSRAPIHSPSITSALDGVVNVPTEDNTKAAPVIRDRDASSTSGIDGVTAHSASSGSPGASTVPAPVAIAVPVGERISTEQAARFADQIAQAIESARGQDDRLRVRLHPPALGALQIEVRMHAGELSARLDVQSPEAHRAIVETLPQLRESLGHAGAVVDRIDVRLVETHGNEPGGDSSQRRHEESSADSGSSDRRFHDDSDRNSQRESDESQPNQNENETQRSDRSRAKHPTTSHESSNGLLGRIDVDL